MKDVDTAHAFHGCLQTNSTCRAVTRTNIIKQYDDKPWITFKSIIRKKLFLYKKNFEPENR